MLEVLYDVEDRGRGRWRLSVAHTEPLSGAVNTSNALRDSLTKNCEWKETLINPWCASRLTENITGALGKYSTGCEKVNLQRSRNNVSAMFIKYQLQ